MKKYLILIATITALPTFATCPIDEESGTCSIAQFEQRKLQQTYSPSKTINEFSGSPEDRLKPAEKVKITPELQDFGNQPKDYSYNADCQFGICKNNSGAPRLFDNRKPKD